MPRLLGVFLCLLGLPAAAVAQVLLNQPPVSNNLGGGGTDNGCTFTTNPNTSSTLAEDFVLTTSREITGVRFQGGYFSPAIPAHPPDFEVRLWADLAGLPGAQVATPAVTLAVTETPVMVSGNFWVYSYTVTFSSPITIGPGTYWIEILETDTTIPACFIWSTGALDPVNGRPGAAVQFPLNGIWLPQASDIYAVTLLSGSVPGPAAIPALDVWGLLALIGGLSVAGWLLLRRKQRVG